MPSKLGEWGIDMFQLDSECETVADKYRLQNVHVQYIAHVQIHFWILPAWTLL